MKRPNILLIITDSQGSNVLGSSGAGHIKTPNIDGLADTGVSFSRAYNTCPLCTPARAGLFCGLYPHNAGAWSNDLPFGTNVPSMGAFFSRIGYEAAYIGKWHLDGTDYFGTGICPDGWNPRYWYDGRNYLEDLSVEERALWRRGLRTSKAIHEHGITREWTWAGRITDKAGSFIENQRINNPENPWLLVVSYDEPHGPSVCPPPFCDMYEDFAYPLADNAGDSLEGKPAHHREWAATFTIPEDGLRQRLYFGAGSFVDDEIGRVIDAARANGAEDTIIIYTTDHGHYLGAHGLDGKGPAMYEEVIRVPFIVNGPGVAHGAKSDSLLSQVDVLPTLLDMTGTEAPEILEGVSQTAALADPDKKVRTEILSEFHRFSVTHDSWFGFVLIRSLVSQRYKLTINLDYSDELYDLEGDPGEIHNRINDPALASVRAGLHNKLLSLMDTSRDPFRGPRWAARSWADRAVPPGIGGSRRPRSKDGFLPVPFSYNTGMPAESRAAEDSVEN